jgi:hypothetical protein
MSRVSGGRTTCNDVNERPDGASENEMQRMKKTTLDREDERKEAWHTSVAHVPPTFSERNSGDSDIISQVT